MDVAVASVITTGAVSIAGLATAVWSTRHNTLVTREGRVQERAIDGYLEILRLVEHKSLWYETSVERAALEGDPHETMPRLPSEPDVGEQATIAALLAAFGTDRLTASCTGWSEAAKELDRLFDVARWNWEQDYHGPETPTAPSDLTNLRTQLAVLVKERGKIETAMAEEIRLVRGGD